MVNRARGCLELTGRQLTSEWKYGVQFNLRIEWNDDWSNLAVI